ncbi:protein of unknown function DUF1223 [Methylocella silvestris BL2]|uniref:DUF1223 domain-containing protein n=1 Tax=Methylocella silvestris (strain DSM 15510 / CIP 108128 / LMG 27833 / NCIMB 13906 / BL2) TaxID=395965 RepID=B8EPJ2_METSB|nr:DUF1223 domain-containing protein [Methylocella silvestris]ACK50197.1 protein of unknown function DUF1223 [Methylocella silvestris BL2]
MELFTSQGCSFCPPADALLATLARKPDVVAVSFPVDYWDYIGWKDTMASPVFAARQRAYAAAIGDQHAYTPQMIVDGMLGAVGSDRKEIESAIALSRGREGAMSVPVRLTQANGALVVEVGDGEGGPAVVLALRVMRSRTVHIGRGENAGRNVTYTNVVRAMDEIGVWSGAAATFHAPDVREDGEGYVIFVQKGSPQRPGVILGAAKAPGF